MPGQTVGETPGHPLDGSFENATSAKNLFDGLLNDPFFKAACAAAVEAFNGTVETREKQPGMVGPSPSHAARSAFLGKINSGYGVQA